MNCEQTTNLLDAYLDQELEPTLTANVATHLQNCLHCTSQLQQRRQLTQALHHPTLHHRAPDSLRAQLSRQIASTSRKQGFRSPTRWLAVAASWAVVAVMAWNVALYQGEQQEFAAQTSEVITSHIRSLQADHLVDIASSDQHNVKPWFNGRVDYSPTVPDLSNQGYPLRGGRLDYLESKPIAVLVYQRRQHIINVFVVPAAAESASVQTSSSRQGYNLIQTMINDLDYRIVSDLNLKELEAFAQLLSAQ